MKQMKSKILLLIAVVLFSATSCEDFLKEEPKSLLSSSTVFANEDGMVAAILGVYDELRGFYSWAPMKDVQSGAQVSG